MDEGGTAGDALAWRRVASGIELSVRLTPKSGKDAVEGLGSNDDGMVYLKARVRAVPEDQKANRALEKLVAKWLGVPKSSVAIISGDKSRLKILAIAGEPPELCALLQERLGQLG
ncbi:MAG: hypothetical protein RLZ98_3199 [Pseudomonadota bacterium]|jgi:uncharacterized protein YggU (UPF0235/DUF167 family)